MTDLRSAAIESVESVETVELDDGAPVDLVTFAGAGGYVFEQEGHGLAGRGEALRIDLPAGLGGDLSIVAEILAALGDGAVALGALPFDRDASASLVVPRAVVRRDGGGRQWLTTIGATPSPEDPPPGPLPDGFSLTSPRSHPEWQDTIAEAVDAIERGDLDKVVVAREVLVEANRPIVVPDVLERLRALYPACVVFSVDGFLGASPELLTERRGSAVRSHPLAGTFPRSGDPHADGILAAELVASVKDQREHRFVIEEIERVLRPMCAALDVPADPSIMQLRNVLHLGTEIGGTLRPPAPTALDIAAALHPTPAVAGTPRDVALEFIAQHEDMQRGWYAGPVGWFDLNGDGELAVALRCVRIEGTAVDLYAGAGIVSGSDPDAEFDETVLKMRSTLASLGLEIAP